MESNLIMQPIRLKKKKKKEGVRLQRSPNNCDSDGDYEAYDFLNGRKLISQTFLKIKIQLFQNSQLHQESNPLTHQGGHLCVFIYPKT